MEPLGQTGATGESILSQEEAVVASVRSAMKELQESIQDLCKASLAKIVTLGQCSSSLVSSSPLFSSSDSQSFLFFVVNPDAVASTPNGAAAAAAGTTAANNSGEASAQNTGTIT